MKTRILAVAVLATISLLLSCQSGSGSASAQPQQESVEAPAGVEASAATNESVADVLEGQVLSTQDGGGYTFIYFKSGSDEFWAAGPLSVVAVGDQVQVQTNMEMGDFYSDSLDRTFEDIYFTMSFGDQIESAGFHGASQPAPTAESVADPHASMLPEGHPSLSSTDGEQDIPAIAKAESGFTVAELWGEQEKLNGTEVVVRGQVVKFMPGIMNRNWLHLKDGTGEAETAAITITTDQQAKVGDIVTVRGQFARNVDFGAGYVYKVIVEGASITVD